MSANTDLERLRRRLADAEAAPTKLNLTFVLPSALDDVEAIAKNPSARAGSSKWSSGQDGRPNVRG